MLKKFGMGKIGQLVVHASYQIQKVSTLRTTSSTAVGSLEGLGQVARDFGAWLHVDVAYASSACVCPKFRHFLDGFELVDSFSMNAHKWLPFLFRCGEEGDLALGGHHIGREIHVLEI
ncbi:hypothetical protein AMTR_s00013p00250260 [Amborella trichopoda]|uniref:Uncharacterized protein n=1 Tax=Amborella trichopoda TaxID=13333 RepID=W1PQR1_AMBTC|nr:hypothetical protein AMTR_s00013p00250260 [Amborella trichopoda]